MNELEIIQAELERRRASEPLRFFRANGAQEKFLQAVADNNNRTILFPAGNWTGKTAGAMALLAACMWPDLAEDPNLSVDAFKNWEKQGFKKNARIVSTPKELENIGSIQQEITRWWPKGRYTSEKKGKQYPCEFRSDTGWVVDLMSYEQHEDEFEGATISLFIFNEPPPERIYDACVSRMKFGGKLLFPMTPLANSAWIYDRLVAKDGTDGIKVIYGETEDNCKEHGKNGVIPHRAIEEFAKSCDPDEREARLKGRFMHMMGQIYKTFDRAVHVIDIPDKRAFTEGKTLYQIVDPAIGKPLAVVYAAVDNIGQLTIWGEHPNFEFNGARDSNLTVRDYVDIFKALEEGRPIAVRILDKQFGNQRGTMGGLTLKQEFAESGMDFQDSYTIGSNEPEIETGILRVKDYLRYDKTKAIDSLNRPRLYVDKSCINVIHSFERWTRNEKTGKPKEEYKDFADCVRYLVMSNPCMDTPREWGVTTANYSVQN